MGHTGLVDVHGVIVRWSWQGLSYDPTEPLLARFPPAVGGAHRITIDIQPADGAPIQPEAQGYRRNCFFGPVLGYTRDADNDFFLTDGASWVWQSGDGSRIQARAAASTPRRLFTAIMVFMALMRALRGRGQFHLHAGAVVTPGGRPWLVVGRSGAGKTTTTLALVRAGFSFLGDDSVLLRQGQAGVEILPLPLDFHLAPRTAEAFADLAPELGETIDEGALKRRLDARRTFASQRLGRVGPPAALVFPAVTDAARTSIEPRPPALAMGELLHGSALLTVEGMADVRSQVALLEAIVGRATCWSLALGADALADPGVVSSGLSRRIEG